MIFYDKVAILGAGLLGGSLAKALKERSLAGRVSVWSRSESTRAKCAAMPLIFDEVCGSPSAAVKNADIVVLCTPTQNIPVLAREICASVKSGAVITDVGSVKAKICAECGKIYGGLDADFVGAHPMAGSEKIGVDYADAQLFENRPCFVASNSTAAEKVSAMWRAVGMRVYGVSPEEHDAIVARVSHLPHLLAGTLCLVSAGYKTDLRPFSGPGFRDTTRVASGSPDIWDSIVADNKDEILAAVKDCAKSLNALVENLEDSDFAAVARRLREAKKFRDGLV